MIHPTPLKGLRAVAVFKACKALLVLLLGVGLIAMLHRDIHALAEAALRDLHFDSDWRVTHYILARAARVTPGNLWLLVGMALAYAMLNGAEASGLWLGRRWAEWLTLGNGAIYMPAEIHDIWQHANWFNVSALIASATITVYMAWLLYHSRKRHREARRAASADQCT